MPHVIHLAASSCLGGGSIAVLIMAARGPVPKQRLMPCQEVPKRVDRDGTISVLSVAPCFLLAAIGA